MSRWLRREACAELVLGVRAKSTGCFRCAFFAAHFFAGRFYMLHVFCCAFSAARFLLRVFCCAFSAARFLLRVFRRAFLFFCCPFFAALTSFFPGALSAFLAAGNHPMTRPMRPNPQRRCRSLGPWDKIGDFMG
jgi:hypothetical protein